MTNCTIGLEIHAELNTQSKMFCGCLNNPRETKPNTNICPVCTGHPGTLPVANKAAIEKVLQLGLALKGTIFPKHRSKFDRKNYFYPDLPKGYQISQYDEPLVEGGVLNNIRIRRIHLEEDTGSLTHEKETSLVDFNRAGTALMELVTEPDMTSADEAVAFGEELQRILRYLKISDADMEHGLMRLEANISINMSTKVEVKNINSFKALHDAIEHEYKRQTALLAEGKKVVQETRGWNADKKETVSQRTKEEAHDYRYFPEPDLPPMDKTAFDLTRLQQEIPELPEEKRKRFMQEYKLGETEVNIIVHERIMAEFFEESASELTAIISHPEIKTYKLLYNYLTSDLWGILKKENKTLAQISLTPAHFAQLIYLIIQEKISSRAAKDILAHMVKTGENPETIIKERGLEQAASGDHGEATIKEILAKNPQAIADYKKGKKEALQFLIGCAMKQLKGAANPTTLKELFEKELNQ